MTNLNYGTGGYGQGGYGNQPIEVLPLGYYQWLLTSQYVNSPKLNALLYVLLKKFDDVSQCLVKFDTAFDLDSAVGPQLDALGAIAGALRTVGFQPSGGVSATLDDDTLLFPYSTSLDYRVAVLDARGGRWPSARRLVLHGLALAPNPAIRDRFAQLQRFLPPAAP